MKTLDPEAINQLARIIENEMIDGETRFNIILANVNRTIFADGLNEDFQLDHSIRDLLYISNYVDMRSEH